MDSVNGTYMICPTINCYYLMYLHYSTLIGIVRQDHNPLLLDDPYLGKPCSSWMGEPVSPPKPRVSSAEARAFSVPVFTNRCMLLTTLSVQCICVWMLSGYVLVDGDYCMKGLTHVMCL